MKQSTVVSLVVIILAAGYLYVRTRSTEFGKVYVQEVPVNLVVENADEPDSRNVRDANPGEEPTHSWTVMEQVDPGVDPLTPNAAPRRDQPDVKFSLYRTVGMWTAAIFTLCIMSFLIGDNFAYRMAEAIFLGVSAAYLMVVGFWDGIVPNLFGKIAPATMKATFIPGLKPDEVEYPFGISSEINAYYYIPLILSVMMLMRLSPKGGWISRWPLAFFIGATAGIKLTAYLGADFSNQIKSTVLPLIVMSSDGSIDPLLSLKNITIVIGVLSSLVYFFFSFEHKGIVGGTARLGIWFLMVTFGAGFAYTVMGRIALISERLKFLFDDWLWLIDPLSRRIGL